MSACRKYFAQRKENIPPAAHGNTKWHRKRLPWRDISGRWEGAQCHGGGLVGEWSTLMGYVRILSCSVVFPVKSEKWKF